LVIGYYLVIGKLVIDYFVDMNTKRCDIILPTCGQAGLIRDCIESLIRSTRYPYRLIAIDNGSSVEASAYLNDISKSGRLDMALINPQGFVIRDARSEDSNERIELNITEAGRYVIAVWGYDDAQNTYDIELSVL